MKVVVCSFAEADRHWRDELHRRAEAAGALEGVRWLDDVCDRAAPPIGESIAANGMVHAVLILGRGFNALAQAPWPSYEGHARRWAPLVAVHRLLTSDSVDPVVVKGVGVGWPTQDWPQRVAQLIDAIRAAPAELRGVRIQSLTVFERIELDLAEGINLVLGPNASGKTHLLKAAYALLTASDDPAKMMAELPKRLAEVLMPADEQLRRLRRWGATAPARVELSLGGSPVWFQLTENGAIDACGAGRAPPPPALFIPARDVLAMYEGFIAAYLKQKISFDATFFDLCVALSAAPLRDGPNPFLMPVVETIEQVLGGKVELRGNRFYVVRQSGQDIEAHLLAEGHRKLASLVQLIRNGSIVPGAVLFWDEPEANLNPRLIKPMAEILRRLAAAKVQILLATHDYLLSQELSMAAEYQTEPQVPMRFFSLYRDVEPDGPMLLERGDTLAELDHNPILEEHNALYDRERALFFRNGSA